MPAHRKRTLRTNFVARVEEIEHLQLGGNPHLLATTDCAICTHGLQVGQLLYANPSTRAEVLSRATWPYPFSTFAEVVFDRAPFFDESKPNWSAHQKDVWRRVAYALQQIEDDEADD